MTDSDNSTRSCGCSLWLSPLKDSFSFSFYWYLYCCFMQLLCCPILKADLIVVLSTYGTTAVLCSVPSSPWDLSFGAAQTALGLLDQVQLFIQGVFLKLELLQEACGWLQLLLQSKDGAVFRFDFIHLWYQRKQHLRTCCQEFIDYGQLASSRITWTWITYIPYQSADVPLTVPLDLGDLLLVLLVLHSQVTSLHLICLDHIAESLVCLFLRWLQLSDLLQELHSLLVKEAPRLLLGFQSERSAHLQEWQRIGGGGLFIIKTD